ncbi:MAG TPA: hypothetical protein VLH09_02270, partial [Bryobacteraceae bacterium]|nr:hypothetical protein [Bryobacteraceae bacterium]
MYSLLFLVSVSLALAAVLTPLVRNLFLRHGLVDPPDARKTHARAVPRIGGIPILAASVISFALLILSPLKAGSFVEQSLPMVWRVLPAIGLIFLTGLADDLKGLKPWRKLAGQTAAAMAACAAGIQIHNIGGHPLPEWLTIPATLVWLVGCANAFNLI